jgi:hypothetical protein
MAPSPAPTSGDALAYHDTRPLQIQTLYLILARWELWANFLPVEPPSFPLNQKCVAIEAVGYFAIVRIVDSVEGRPRAVGRA